MKIFTAKKGQGLSMNVIIIAAIALLVLVVLAVIFIGRSGQFASATKSCASQGGQCGSTEDAAGKPVLQNVTGCASGQVCYLPIG